MPASPVSSRTALLQALSMGPGYGLQLIGRIAEATSGHIVLNRGFVYKVLARLEEGGYVHSYEREEISPGKKRWGRPFRYYELTDKGKAEWQRVKSALEGLGL